MPVTPLAINEVNPSILAFKPRQLLLSLSNSNMKNNKSDLLNLKEDQKALVVVSIARYLENNGFTKTLKKFRSEAEIEKDYSNSSSPALEEVFCKYFQACDNGATNIQTGAPEVEAKPKKTKKGENKTEPEEKSKKKKKNKLDSESPTNDDVEHKKEILSEENGKKSEDSDSKKLTEAGTGAPVEDQKIKSKGKKKKMDASENLSVKEEQGKLDDEAKPDKKEGKSSKKRKREVSEENENHNNEVKAIEENTEGVGKENNGNFDAVANGDIEKSEEKSAKKQKYDSAEPQTKRFQRVKVEEVEFADERLEDNSYWSKDGAENGYGAKAQEIPTTRAGGSRFWISSTRGILQKMLIHHKGTLHKDTHLRDTLRNKGNLHSKGIIHNITNNNHNHLRITKKEMGFMEGWKISHV